MNITTHHCHKIKFQFLPKDEVAQLFFQFVWLSNAVVSPIAYFALRSRNAKTSERGTGTLTAVG